MVLPILKERTRGQDHQSLGQCHPARFGGDVSGTHPALSTGEAPEL